MRSRYLLVAPSLFLLAWATPARAVPEFDGLFQTVALHDDVHGMALGDLDGDGKQDLIVALEEDIAVLHGSGDGTFGVETDYATGGSLAQDVALADFNGDGRLDVVCVDTTGALSLFLNDGAGGLLAPANYPSGTPLVSVIAGDFNGDGHADVAACGAFNAVVWLWAAPGVLGAPALLPVHVPANDIVIGDFDADGKPDLVLACGSVSVFKGNGNGTFGPELAMGSVGPGRYVAVGDLNGDIYPDVLLTLGGNSAMIFLNNGGAGLGTQVFVIGSAVRSPAAWIADLNGDGLADVLTSGTFSVNAWLRSGPGTFGTFLRSQSGNHWQGQSALGDLNGDGKVDMVIENYPNIIDVHLGNGDGSFGPKRSYNSGSSNGVLAGDFNGDGHRDVFVTNGTVFPGSGHGDLGSPITTNGISFSYDSQVAADFDGDGKVDVAGVEGNTIVIEKGVGNGTFTLGASLPDAAQSLAEGDWNGDGIPDLVAGETGSLSIYLGHGDLTFDHFTTAAPGQTLKRPRVGDFNGDGKADVACENADFISNVLSIFIGHGDGSFDGPVSIPVSSAGVVNNLAVGDLNGDGRSDLVACTDTLWVLLNQGDGTFQRTSYPQIPETLFSEFLIGDFNGDGYPDLAAGDGWFDAIGIFPGNGHGALGPPSYYGFSHRIASIAAGDFDEDGALDLLAVNPDARFVSLLLHSPPQAVPALFSVTRAEALADRVEVSWYTALDPGAKVSVSRTDAFSGWRPVGSTIVDGAHSITFVDRDITPGAHYGYAVSADGPLSGDVWVDVPSRTALAFLGAQPNPARGALTLAIQLASARPAVIEVFSVDGRRLLLQKISGEEAGEHLIRLGRALPAGVHIVRLTQGGRSITGRIAVLQ